jgi:hypothetical protein
MDLKKSREYSTFTFLHFFTVVAFDLKQVQSLSATMNNKNSALTKGMTYDGVRAIRIKNLFSRVLSFRLNSCS